MFDGGVKPLAGLHANYHHVQGVRQGLPDLGLAPGCQPLQNQGGDQVAAHQQQIKGADEEDEAQVAPG